MRDPIGDFLMRRPFMVLDGALATELELRGADIADPLWSARCLMERPELIEAVHYDYFAAGADVATTATYQATFEGFARRGLSAAEAADLMRSAVRLAAQARDRFWADAAHRAGRLRPLIAASVGPYGAMLADGSEYRGGYAASDAALADFHRPRLQVLAAAGADVLAIETLPCLREALVLARLLDELSAITAWIAFSCRDAARNSEGEGVGECAAALGGYRSIVAVGVNCTAPEHLVPLLRSMRACTERPLVAYPNSGGRYDASRKSWSGSAAHASFGDLARAWRTEGARLVGGCCRTGPSDIEAVARCA